MRENKKYVITTVCASFFISMIVFVVIGIWPFGDKTIVTGDLGGQYINFYSHYAQAIKNGRLDGFIYGFDKSLGGTLIGNFAYYFSSIFNIAYFFFLPDKYPMIVTSIYVLKLMLASGTMCWFLNKKYNNLGAYSVAISLCYAYCAFSTVYYQNIMWFDALIFLPIIAYGINQIIYDRGFLVYILFLAFTIISNFYTGYMVCIFCVIYFFYEIISNSEYKSFLKNCFNFGLSSIIAGGLSAFLVIPMLIDVLAAKNSASGFELSGMAAFKFTEFFYRLFPFNFTWADVHEGLPNVYTGTLCIVGLALFLSAGNIKIKEKISTIIVLVVLFLSMYSFDFMVFWHGLKEPVWFPYRNTFIFSFFLCLITARALEKLDLSYRSLLISAVIIVFLVARAFLIRNIWFTLTLLCLGILFLGIQYITIAVTNITGKFKKISIWMIVLVCIAELSLNSLFNISQFENYSSAYLSEYYWSTAEIINSAGKDGEYSGRIEKDFYRTLNDPMMFGYPGIGHFGSTEDSGTNDILNLLGFGAEYYTGNTTAFADSLIGLEYVAFKNNTLPAHFEDVKVVNNVTIAKNKFVFPLVYRCEESGKEFISTTNAFESQNNLYRLLGGNGELFTPYQGNIATAYDGKIKLPYDRDIYYYIAVSNEGGTYDYYCNSSVDGDNVVFEPVIYENIENIYVWEMDVNKLAYLSSCLQDTSGEATLTAASFESKVNCVEDGTYIINIPWSQYLKVTVNGKEMDTYSGLAGFTAINLEKGEQNIKVSGRVVGGEIGIFITIASLALMIACTKFIIMKNKYTEL